MSSLYLKRIDLLRKDFFRQGLYQSSANDTDWYKQLRAYKTQIED